MKQCISCHKETEENNFILNFWNEPLCNKCDMEIIEDLKIPANITYTSSEFSKVIENVITYINNNIDDCRADGEDSDRVRIKINTLYDVLEKINEEMEI